VKNFARYQLPAIVWAAIIFMLSSFPKLPTMPTGLFSIDKILHFGVYFILGLLIAVALIKSHINKTFIYRICVAAILGIVYGASDEFHQSFIAGRDASVADWIADALGVVSAQIFMLYLHNKSKLISVNSSFEKNE
jgi:VanZ family protein